MKSVYFFLSLVLFITSCNGGEGIKEVPVAVEGLLDLSGVNFDEFIRTETGKDEELKQYLENKNLLKYIL